MSATAIRPATAADLPDIVRLVRELAAYEREPDAVQGDETDFGAVLFPQDGAPTAFCHVAEAEDAGGERRVVGIALWYLTFSTWESRNGMWLEDLYVEEAHRGTGLGAALLRTLAGVCLERGYTRLEWVVLRWNEPSIRFYESVGAVPMDQWETYRLTGDALRSYGSR